MLRLFVKLNYMNKDEFLTRYVANKCKIRDLEKMQKKGDTLFLFFGDGSEIHLTINPDNGDCINKSGNKDMGLGKANQITRTVFKYTMEEK